MKELEYVASGMGYTRLSAPRNREADSEALKFLQETLKKVEEFSDHKFSMLFNAFTELGIGQASAMHRGISFNNIYSDSGGLQIATLGEEVTADQKKTIYDVQAKYSDFAMSFDEIPIVKSSKKSDRNDTSTRFFDRSLLEEKARESGRNLLEQIEYFVKVNSPSKPFMIAHGNCLDTYKIWTEELLKEIPKELHEKIGGVAIAGPVMGHGPLEDIQRAYISTQLPFDYKHVHVLGVGSLRRIAPYIIMDHNGMYPEDMTISYDSTSHTQGLEFAAYFHSRGVFEKYTRHQPDQYIKVYNDILLKFPELAEFSHRQFMDVFNNGYLKCTEKLKMDPMTFLKIKTFYIVASISNFCMTVDRMKDRKGVLDVFNKDKKIIGSINSIYSIKDDKTYSEWLDYNSARIKSSRVMPHNSETETISVEDFF